MNGVTHPESAALMAGYEANLAAAADRAQIIAIRRHQERKESGDVRPEHWYEAEEEVRADADTYADWLASECIGFGAVNAGYIPTHDTLALTERIAGMSVPELVTVTRCPFKQAKVAALDELERRYVERPSMQRRVLKRAQEIAGEAE